MTEMTQSPIEPRHKDMAAKAAGYQSWASLSCFTADGAVQTRILAHAQTLANLEAAQDETTKAVTQLFVAKKALAEIDRIAVGIVNASGLDRIAAIAAPYRAPTSDPVAEALKAALASITSGGSLAWAEEAAPQVKDALASRGLEIVERRDR